MSTDQLRPDHTRALPAGSTVVLFTDGLIENPAESLDQGLSALAELAAGHATASPHDLVSALLAHHPSDGHDDMAVLALRIPG